MGPTANGRPADELTGKEAPADPPSGPDAFVALLLEGRTASAAGDDAAASRAYLAVLDATRGTGSPFEHRALAHLTSLYMAQAREIEGLRLARRLTELAARGDPAQRAWAQQAVCMAFANIEDWPRVAREFPAFEAAVASCSPELQAVYDRAALVLLGRLALDRGDLAGAARHGADAIAASDASPHAWTRLASHALSAWAAYRRGLFREGLDTARRAHALAPSPASALESVHVEALCTFEVEGPAAAAAVVRKAIDDIEARPKFAPGPAHLAHFGPGLAELAQKCGDEPLARRVCDLAAAGMLGRLVELEREVGGLPELREGNADDEAALTAFRTGFRERKTALLARVAELLRPSGGAAFLHGGDDALRVCAWCVRSLQDDGSWQPFGHVAHAISGVRVTHGICPSCAAAHPS